jgi:signal transduction histidine kinase
MASLDFGLVAKGQPAGLGADPTRIGRSTKNLMLASNPETLINISRLVTAVFAVLAVYLDPIQPAPFLVESQVTLGLYMAFSLLLVIFPVRKALDSPLHLGIHIIDVAILGFLAFLTNELSSPFFSFSPFILLAMTLRWGLKGAVMGAVALQLVLIIVGVPDLDDGQSELNVFIMRSTYFMVAAVMLGYLGAYREHHRKRLAQLAHWPFDAITGDRLSWLRGLCNHAAGVLGDPSLLVIWRDQEEDVGSVAYWLKGELRLIEVRDAAFWCQHDPEPPMLAPYRGETPMVSDDEVGGIFRDLPELAAEVRDPSNYVCSAAFSSVRYRGRVFVINPACHPDECGSLTEIIAMKFRSELGRLALMQQTTEAARAEERARLARDLHDSILQDLTAASLKLKFITKSVSKEAKANVVDVNSLVFNLQQRIRQFVDDQRSVHQYETEPLDQTLLGLVTLLGQQWDCRIDVVVDPPNLDVHKSMQHEIMQLVSEATANSVRHGKATRVRIEVVRVDGGIELEISDNGSGTASNVEPKRPLSLSARVNELKGNLTICGASPGLSLRIALPLGEVSR